MAKKKGALRVGTSGYQYDHWRGLFYPQGVPKKGWFSYYARHFDTVEINNTFYQLPKAKTFDAWHDAAPKNFCYALKFSRFGTHVKRLRDPEQPVQAFLERAERLKSFLGPILVQLPPHWHAVPERLEEFLRVAPRRQRWAIEFRDPSWLCDDVYSILKKHNAALCIHDLIEDHPRIITAGWVYQRFHGVHYGDSYSPQFLAARAKEIKQHLAEGKDVFVYFNNDIGGHAVHNAAELRRYASED